MPISTTISTSRQVLTPREITTRHRLGGQPERPASASCPRPAEACSKLGLCESPLGDAAALRHARAWQAHVDAGRIGVPAPVAVPGNGPPPGFELRFASLAAALGHAGRGSVW